MIEVDGIEADFLMLMHRQIIYRKSDGTICIAAFNQVRDPNKVIPSPSRRIQIEGINDSAIFEWSIQLRDAAQHPDAGFWKSTLMEVSNAMLKLVEGESIDD